MSRSYFENPHRGTGSVLQVMSVRIAGEKGGAISRVQDLFAAFGNKHDLSLQDIDEFLRVAVPMPLTGPGAGL